MGGKHLDGGNKELVRRARPWVKLTMKVGRCWRDKTRRESPLDNAMTTVDIDYRSEPDGTGHQSLHTHYTRCDPCCPRYYVIYSSACFSIQ